VAQTRERGATSETNGERHRATPRPRARPLPLTHPQQKKNTNTKLKTYPPAPPLALHPSTFRFVSIGADSALLRSAFARYRRIVFQSPVYFVGALPAATPARADGSAGPPPTPIPPPPPPGGTLAELRVFVGSTDQSLGEQTDESYSLAVGSDAVLGKVGGVGGVGAAGATSTLSTLSGHGRRRERGEIATIQAASVYGALRGLETFAQLVDRVDAECEGGRTGSRHRHRHHKRSKKHHRHHRHHQKDEPCPSFSIRPALIFDEPRFPHRGLLLDTARHFLPLPAILATLDALAATKMNYLHLHLTDDQAFSVSLPGGPFADGQGAIAPGAFYSPADVAAIVAAARARGIRVIPEFDVPGHSASWGRALDNPSVLTPCLDPRTGAPTGDTGPLNPASNATWDALWAVLAGSAALFPDAAVHLGGDEAALGCWAAHPAVRAWGSAVGAATPRAILARFMEKAVALAAAAGRMAIVWQEVLDAGAALPTGRGGAGVPPATVQVWKWWEEDKSSRTLSLPPPDFAGPRLGRPAAPWERELAAVTAGGRGHRALLSAPFYLNLGARGTDPPDWEEMFRVDPTAALVAAGGEHASGGAGLVRGGEAVAWGEGIDGQNLFSVVWPRAAVVGEVLWSQRAGGGGGPRDEREMADARFRLAVHRCRLLSRGIGAAPVTGPGWCPGDASAAVAGLEGWRPDEEVEEEDGGRPAAASAAAA
jgi:hexosaminidase